MTSASSQSAVPAFRVLFHFRTRGTGAEGVHLAGMARGFAAHGGEVTFLSPTGNDPRESRGDNPFGAKRESLLARLSRRCPRWVFELLELGYNAAALFRVGREVSGGHYTFVYERHAFFLWITAWLADWRHFPLVVEVNELAGDARIRAQPSFSGLVAWADRFVFERATLVTVVSPHLARRAIERGAKKDRVLVLPNAVESHVAARPVDSAERERIRARWKVEPGEVIVGFVGWFVEWHRLDRLVDVVGHLARSGLPVKLMLVGEGPLRDALAAQARDAGVADRLIFTGAVSHDAVADMIAAFDIAVVPHSNDYRSPIKLFEYWASARAVVAPRLEPVESVAGTDDSHALLFDAGNADSLQSALHRLALDSRLREKLGAEGKALVQERHTWDRNARRVLDALNVHT